LFQFYFSFISDVTTV